MKTKIKDLIVVVPGIMGSVLTKNDKNFWSASFQTIGQSLRTYGDNFNQLKLEGDDLERDDLGDGIKATGLIQFPCIIPRFWKKMSYERIRRWIIGELDCTMGHFSQEKAGNYYEFPYDWRRDNRYTAKKLKKSIDKALHQWRKASSNPDAKVILIGHSMGGLVSRYYLEVLGGWRDCKALFTLGTPHRGSGKALNSLVNGLNLPVVSLGFLTPILRGMTSPYQLLPNYPCIENDGEFTALRRWKPNGIDAEKINAGLDFHMEIKKAETENKKDATYGYDLIPILGTGQRMAQSFLGKNGKIEARFDLPAGIGSNFWDSDGTVPRISAFPENFRGNKIYSNEKHASLQSNSHLLRQITESIKSLQHSMVGVAVGESGSATMEGSLSLEMEDIYLEKQAISVNLFHVSNYNLSKTPIELSLTLKKNETKKSFKTTMAQNEFQVDLGVLEAGAYEIELEANHEDHYGKLRMKDSFVVVGKN